MEAMREMVCRRFAAAGVESSTAFDSSETSPILGRLNHERELLRRAIPGALLIWLPDFALDCVARGAPDFWAWRSGVYEFPIEETLWREIDDALSLPSETLDVESLLPVEEKQKEAARLESLLQTARAMQNQDSRSQAVITRLLKRLGDLRYSLGDLEVAQQLYRQSLDISKKLGDEHGVAHIYRSLGRVAESRG
jgi:tetratricopeptide (TPR) repeat protein